MSDSERDARNGRQWLDSVLSYLDFRAGSSWRRLSDPSQRWNPSRLYYLEAIRLIHALRHEAAPALAVHITISSAELHCAALAKRGRAWLVDALMTHRPCLTDRKLLMRLAPMKLAVMLCRASDGATDVAEVAA